MLAFSLSAHLLQVIAIEGLLEEVVPLLSVIPASPRPQNWLVTLEEKMRNTLVQCLAECVERRLNGRESPSKLLELVTTLGENLALFVLMWLDTVCDTCVSFTIFLKKKPLFLWSPKVATCKNTNFGFLITKLTPLPWQHE